MSQLAKISKILGSVLEHFTRSQELTLQGGDGGKKIVVDLDSLLRGYNNPFPIFNNHLFCRLVECYNSE